MNPSPDPPQYITSTSTDFQVTVFRQLAFSVSFENEMSNEKFKVSQLEGKVTTLEGKVATNTSNIATNTTNIATNTTNISSNIANLATTNANLATTDANLVSTNAALSSVSGTVTAQGITIGLLQIDSLAQATSIGTLQVTSAALVASDIANVASIAVLNGNQTSLSATPFFSVSGSPAEGGAGDFVLSLGSEALPLTNGGTGLTTIGAFGTVLTSNGTAASWYNL